MTLTTSTAARLVVSRPPPGGLGDPYPITVSLDGERIGVLMPGDSVEREVTPGRHRLKAFNTLLWRNVDVDVSAGEEARYVVSNRAGFGTMFVALLGTGPLYPRIEREPATSR
jgi:hypothetical protein